MEGTEAEVIPGQLFCSSGIQVWLHPSGKGSVALAYHVDWARPSNCGSAVTVRTGFSQGFCLFWSGTSRGIELRLAEATLPADIPGFQVIANLCLLKQCKSTSSLNLCILQCIVVGRWRPMMGAM